MSKRLEGSRYCGRRYIVGGRRRRAVVPSRAFSELQVLLPEPLAVQVGSRSHTQIVPQRHPQRASSRKSSIPSDPVFPGDYPRILPFALRTAYDRELTRREEN